MTGDWRRIELSREQIRAGELEKIRAQFSLFMMTNETAGEMALFTRRGKAGGCEVYFPPVVLPFTVFVFEHHTAHECRAPALLGTTLLAGSHDAVAALLGRFAEVITPRKTSVAPTVGDAGFLQPGVPENSKD